VSSSVSSSPSAPPGAPVRIKYFIVEITNHKSWEMSIIRNKSFKVTI
jgi:hypothetical protein